MCVLARINHQPVVCYTQSDGHLDIRNEQFDSIPVAATDSIEIHNHLDRWEPISLDALAALTRIRMEESLIGLKRSTMLDLVS